MPTQRDRDYLGMMEEGHAEYHNERCKGDNRCQFIWMAGRLKEAWSQQPVIIVESDPWRDLRFLGAIIAGFVAGIASGRF